MNRLADYLKSIRIRRRLSLREVEDLSGVSNAYISLIERGERTDPHPNILKKLANAYGIELSKLMEIAGYLNHEPNKKDGQAEIELEYQEAISDPAFAAGFRLKDKKTSAAVKAAIVELYRKVKSQG